MNNKRKIIFISDLHLNEAQPEITKQFVTLLYRCIDPSHAIKALYILGDLFETWIGDDDDNLFHRHILQTLNEATQKGLRIYIMHGNRDFLIGKSFLRQTGCVLLPDEQKISAFGTPVLLMHGDTLCTRDQAYLKARQLGHNRFLQFLFLHVPLSMRRKFAEKMRAKSTRHTQSSSQEIMDVTLDEVERVMLKYQVNYLIHGHTHRPKTHHFTLNHTDATRIVLAAWHPRGTALQWDETGKQETIEW